MWCRCARERESERKGSVCQCGSLYLCFCRCVFRIIGYDFAMSPQNCPKGVRLCSMLLCCRFVCTFRSKSSLFSTSETVADERRVRVASFPTSWCAGSCDAATSPTSPTAQCIPPAVTWTTSAMTTRKRWRCCCWCCCGCRFRRRRRPGGSRCSCCPSRCNTGNGFGGMLFSQRIWRRIV